MAHDKKRAGHQENQYASRGKCSLIDEERSLDFKSSMSSMTYDCKCHSHNYYSHPPCILRTPTGTTESSAGNLKLASDVSRWDIMLSKVRSRPTIPPFSHPLATHETTEDVLVDFDGPEDPFRPTN